MPERSKVTFSKLEAEIRDGGLDFRILKLASAIESAAKQASKGTSPEGFKALILAKYKELMDTID